MKQSDIITIILVTMIGMIASSFAMNAMLKNPDDETATWKSITVVSSDVQKPDPEVFNPDAINPTVEVYVGNCVDLDQDGALSQEEQIVCGWLSSSKQGSSSNKSQSSSNKTNSSSSNSNGSGTALTLEEILRRRKDGSSTTDQGGSSTTNTVASMDGARKTDLDLFMDKIGQFNGNNRGKSPDAEDWEGFVSTYYGEGTKFEDPNGAAYTIVDQGALSETLAEAGITNVTALDDKIYVYHNAVCGEESGTVTFANVSDNKVAVLFKYEGDGYFCSVSQ